MSDDLTRDEILDAGPDDGDWKNVIHRTKRARRRQGVYGIVLLTAFVLVGVASAYALGHPIVDFGAADKAPDKAVAVIGGVDAGAPEGMATGVLPGQAREITGLSVNGKPYEVSVAPTRDGGFCISTRVFGGWDIPCLANNADRLSFEKSIFLSISAQSVRGQIWISGAFLESEGERLEIAYADGTNDEIPFVWVTAPINAGVFVRSVSEDRRVDARWPVSITLFDRDRKVLARESLHLEWWVG